jgi:subtilase family serine protease
VAAFAALGAKGQEYPSEVGTVVRRAEVSPRTPQAGHIVIPESSIERPEDAGVRFHTNYVFRSEDGVKPLVMSTPQALAAVQSEMAPFTTFQEAETPASLGCLYVSSPASRSTGCIPDLTSGGPSNAGWGAIALVDAFDNPAAASDLSFFDSYWGLPAANFVKIYANGNGDCVTPPANAGWAVEESLDIEWAHVFAPKATIVLVEACSDLLADLFYAEGVAINFIQTNYGGGQVSNSWGGGEFSGENSNDPIFAGWHYNYKVPVVTFAAAGDSGCGAAYPSSNPWLTSVGGTSVLRNTNNGAFSSEACWGGSGGGSSVYETYATTSTGSHTGPWADYQYPIFGKASRQTPDLASDADPASGVYVFNEYTCGGWCVVGGTSVATPSLAGIVNRANNRLSTWFGYAIHSGTYFTNEENNLLYSQLPTATAYHNNFYDIKTGSNGCKVAASWDYCTGVGSPRDLGGK